MIVTEIYQGQGFGNQLWVYVSLRVLAIKLGFDFGIMGIEKFKGSDFMALNFGQPVLGGKGPEGGPPQSLPEKIENYYREVEEWHPFYGCDIRDFDENLLKIKDNTKIDGNLQSEKLILPYHKEICDWLTIDPNKDCEDFSRENICILNVRGGEYKGNYDLILRRKYWRMAMANMRSIRADMEFIIITDDVPYASWLLPEVKSLHFNIGKDYAIVKNAFYLILANSSFSFFPAWTSQSVRTVIAPKYWARHNISDGFWSCAYNLYQGWLWQDREGKLFTAADCEHEYAVYQKTKRYVAVNNREPVQSKPKIQQIFLKIFRLYMKVLRSVFP